jgi:dTDP-4-dehydrorhamnose 3,5-epimerase
MIFRRLAVPDARVIELEPHRDERGFFARTWCRREFREEGLETTVAQCSLSYNRRRGTLRGMHFQAPPHGEVKIVRCVRGAIHDVIIDLRPGSPTFTRHVAVELTADNRHALYVPKGFAHGFQTLEDDTEVLYRMSEFYAPDHARGVRFDDPAFAIEWPVSAPIVKERDRSWPDFDPDEVEGA